MDYIRKFFGLPDHQNSRTNRNDFGGEPPNKFRKPIWNWEDDDDEDERNQPPSSFQVFSNPVEIHRFFEHQMNEMLKMFQGLDQSSMFSQEEPVFDGDSPAFGDGGHMFGMPSLPFHFTPGGSDKSDKDNGSQGTGRPLRDYYFKPGFQEPPHQRAHQDRQDSDLDDKVKSGDLGSILESLPASSDPQPDMHQKSGWYRSVITFTTTRPDGSVEEHRTVDNGNGKEEIITRTTGDKTYSVRITTDSNGVQTRTEKLINVDKDTLNEFEKNWEDRDAVGLKFEPFTWFNFDKMFK